MGEDIRAAGGLGGKIFAGCFVCVCIGREAPRIRFPKELTWGGRDSGSMIYIKCRAEGARSTGLGAAVGRYTRCSTRYCGIKQLLIDDHDHRVDRPGGRLLGHGRSSRGGLQEALRFSCMAVGIRTAYSYLGMPPGFNTRSGLNITFLHMPAVSCRLACRDGRVEHVPRYVLVHTYM